MKIVNSFYFLKDETSVKESPVTFNTTGDQLTVQVDGDATSIGLSVLGCSDMTSNEYYTLTGIDNGYNLISKITAKGLYLFSIDGISKIKINLTTVSGGKVSVFGKISMGA